jgi:hypothetical protein
MVRVCIDASYCKINLTRIIRFKKENPTTDVYDLESLKRWVREWAYAIDGIADDDDARAEASDSCEGTEVPGQDTVRKRWNEFTAGWARQNPSSPMPAGIAASVTAVCASISLSDG